MRHVRKIGLAFAVLMGASAKIRLHDEYGRVELEGTEADTIEVKIAAGPIRLNGVSGKLHLDTDAGAISVENADLRHDLLARTSVGDIVIHPSQAPSAAHLDLRSEIGTVTADVEGVRYERNTSTQKIGTIGTSGPRIEAYSATGNIDLRAAE